MPKSEADLHATLVELLRPDTTPKQLLKQLEKAHPKASNKEIIRAALGLMISVADSDPAKAAQLQDFALKTRGSV